MRKSFENGTMVSVVHLEKKKKDKGQETSQLGMLGSVLSLIAGLFGVIAFFVSIVSRVDESPLTSMVGAIVLLAIAASSLYLFRSKQKDKAIPSITDSSNQRLADRMENLEALICRLDRELNQQMEQSLFLLNKPLLSEPGVSQMPTSLLKVASVLDERYQMLRELGHGGMGVVLQAYDKQLKEQVAIKILSPLLSCNPEAIERLRREVSAARRVTHPNVIRIHDISETNGLSYVSMEYFEGMNLKEFIRQQGPLSNALSYQIAIQICDGLEAAHQQNVIHRDLKSQNIIINRTNQIKIIDFGLARSKHMEGMTATGLIMGTPEYMSPEQVSGKNVDECADIYSFGIILYELLTGSVPFGGESAISIGFKQIKDDPPPPRSLNSKIPEELELVILKALQKNPRDRYSSCAELRRALQEAVRITPLVSHPDVRESPGLETTRE